MNRGGPLYCPKCHKNRVILRIDMKNLFGVLDSKVSSSGMAVKTVRLYTNGLILNGNSLYCEICKEDIDEKDINMKCATIEKIDTVDNFILAEVRKEGRRAVNRYIIHKDAKDKFSKDFDKPRFTITFSDLKLTVESGV